MTSSEESEYAMAIKGIAKKHYVASGLALCLGAALTGGCNTHPVEYTQSSGAIEVLQNYERGASQQLDILWMIDNSGSMCQEQKLIRDNFERFVDTLTSIDVDFHIGVTTTHMPDNYPLEPVAKPGHLQAKPQPIPGFDASCYHKLSPDGQIDRSDFEPVVEAIGLAVDCTQDPGQFANLRNPSPQDLRCAFYPNEAGACPNGPVARESLFPPLAAYRSLPKVLRAQDYRQPDQSLDIPRLKRDFACMSMVGTRGYGFEKGLSVVVRAVHPDLTGGPTGDPASFPNAGFLRQDARLGIIFVSDENDCTHNGSLNEQTSCGVAECSFRDNMGSANSPLVPVRELKGQLMQNLRASKGRQVAEDEVLVASIHGQYRVFSQERPAECASGYNIPPSCASLQGIAYSGHRYEEFLRLFPNFFPSPDRDSPELPLDGLICSDFGPAIEDIANFFKAEGGGCVYDVYYCQGPEAACPNFPHSGQPGTCTATPQNDGDYFCNSGIQVRLGAPQGDLARLQNTGYCIEGTIDQPDFPGGCVVDPVRYRWDACPGSAKGLALSWVDAQWNNILSGVGIQIRYAQVPRSSGTSGAP